MRHVKLITRKGIRFLWLRVKPLMPILAPFLVAIVFVVLYCGPNFGRAIDCVEISKLRLASGPEGQTTLGPAGKPSFYTFDLGVAIQKVIGRYSDRGVPWWSLEFLANPDAFDRIDIEHRPSAGTLQSIQWLFEGPQDKQRVDLAILQDGLIIDGALEELGMNHTDEIRALVPLYRSVLCAFVRKDAPFKRLKDLHGRDVRAYLGQNGSGSRYLVDQIMSYSGIRCREVHSDWTARRVAETMSGKREEQDFDVAFVLDKLDSGVIRTIVDGGKHDLMTLDPIEDLFHRGAPLGGRRSVRRVSLQPSALSEVHAVPGREVATIESQTILACSRDMPDWHAYQIARILSEHIKEIGLGADAADRVHDDDPATGFDYPIHDGAARYFRHGKVEPFPYSTLVVAIGASIALVVYWTNLAMKWRADRLIREIDAFQSGEAELPSIDSQRMELLKLRGLELFKDGRINKEGYERFMEYLKAVAQTSAQSTPAQQRASQQADWRSPSGSLSEYPSTFQVRNGISTCRQTTGT